MVSLSNPVSKPWGDSNPHDVGIENGPNFLRVHCHPEERAFCATKDLGAPCEASRFLRRNNRTLGALPCTTRTGTGYLCQFKPNYNNNNNNNNNKHDYTTDQIDIFAAGACLERSGRVRVFCECDRGVEG